jgi:hypothetical protein
VGQNVALSAAFEKESQEPTATHGTLSLYHGETKLTITPACCSVINDNHISFITNLITHQPYNKPD